MVVYEEDTKADRSKFLHTLDRALANPTKESQKGTPQRNTTGIPKMNSKKE